MAGAGATGPGVADPGDEADESAGTEKRWNGGEAKIEHSRMDPKQPRKTRAEHGASLRETEAAEFEAKRNLAKQKVEQAQLGPMVQKGAMHARGQLGQQFRSFADIQNNMSKLKQNVDLVMSGQMSLAELDDLACASELLQGDKSNKSPMKQLYGGLPVCNN